MCIYNPQCTHKKRKKTSIVLLAVVQANSRPWTHFSQSVRAYQSGISLTLGTVVTSWNYCSRGKWQIRPAEFTVSRFSGIFKDYFECCVSEAKLEVPCEIFSTFCGLFLLLNNTTQARFWSVFKVGEQDIV